MKTLTKSTATELQLCAAWSGDAFAITIIYRPEDGVGRLSWDVLKSTQLTAATKIIDQIYRQH